MNREQKRKENTNERSTEAVGFVIKSPRHRQEAGEPAIWEIS